ncbi:uncharacterized protein LOC125044241 isoform X2 [Penaeus chinensis]|uniref:uncharacterized protein LOC125044241 isoform X2 n=1 Tax=Penaeus chinensis TaxID=139456 RepID=UPI001FB6C3EB|nr:uncharacterized protein LOC125044241 isoform X2 [Penaeus chinensis]
MEPHPKRRKRPSFSDEELRVLLQEVSKRKKVLLGKFDAISVTVQSKVEAWDAVTEAINGVSCVMREREEVRRKFAHHRWFVKKKAKAKGRRGGKTSDADTLSDPEEAMLSMISETVSNSHSGVCESESPLRSVCEDTSEAVRLTPLRSDIEDHSVGKSDFISSNADHSLRGLRNFRMNRRGADSVQKLNDDTEGTPLRIENEETNPTETDISDVVTSRSTMEGLRHFRIDKEEISKDQTLLLRYFRKEMKSSGNSKLTKKDHHSNSEKLKIWSHEGVLQLVEAYRTHMHMFSMTSLNSSQIWCKIAEALQDSGYTYTGELCKRKMQNLSTRYKSITENQENGRGRIKWSKWEYFDTMQDLFAGSPSGDTSFETSLDLSLPTDPDDDPLQVDEVKTEQDCLSPEYTDDSLQWSGVKTEFCHSSSEPDNYSLSWEDVKTEESSLFPEPVEDLLPWSGVKVELCSSSNTVH